jgi:hypothetical protein
MLLLYCYNSRWLNQNVKNEYNVYVYFIPDIFIDGASVIYVLNVLSQLILSVTFRKKN